ncbi:MAG: FAD-binding oxidoreductase, partial [Dehalococcoidia bacterium]|nr:FAD-binding oxidoreductase [Dehalococcoidia bacterium]
MTFAKPFASTLTATSNLEAGLTDLAANLVGRLVTPADTDYDELRAIPNLGYDRRPAAIVRVEATRDISEAVNFARTYGIGLGVRGGGHSIAGFSAVEGGIIVDMRTFKGVIIDPIARVGRVQGGATTADIMIPAHEVGLALSTGDTKTVGVGGLTN